MTRTDNGSSFPVAGYGALAAGVILGAMLVTALRRSAFTPYFGTLSPVLAVIGTCVAGFLAFWLLHTRHHFPFHRSGISARERASVFLLAIPFMVAVTAADLSLRFPADINVPLPTALVFYPVMGFVAQTLLHILPLLLLLLVSSRLLCRLSESWRVGVCIVLVASVEAGFQIAHAMTEGQISTLAVFVGVHLLLFGLVELYLFRRFDFVAMFGFRMVYYAGWHLAWGSLRLRWLFPEPVQ